MFLFHNLKIDGPILSFWIWYRYLRCSNSKNVWESRPYLTGKKISALLNDWENNIAYWEECKQNQVLTSKCHSFHAANSWWVRVEVAQPKQNVIINKWGYELQFISTTFYNLQFTFRPFKLTQTCYLHYKKFFFKI